MFIIQEQFTVSWRFWLFWALAFLSFPIGGLFASALVGPVTTTLRAGLAGAITGAILGLTQWLILRGQIPVPIGWVFATGAGMSVGLGAGVALLGSDMTGSRLLWRAAITGLSIGLAQWFFLRQILPHSVLWIAVIALGWVTGWFVTRSAGVDLAPKWSVFGATGALAFQFLSGLALYFLLRS